MNIFDWLKNLFKSKQQEPIAETEVQTPIWTESRVEIVEPTNQEVEFPHWLSNEDALRDEGVIFGLGDANIQEKLKNIDAIFAQKTSNLSKKHEELSEKIAELNLEIEKNHQENQDIDQRSKTVADQQLSDDNLIRVAVGLIISIGMCVGNYALIDSSLSQGMPQNHQWISWGVFLTGMFSLFNPTSVLHTNDNKINWKNILEEFGVPLSAATFVFIQVYDALPIYKSLALLFFVFFAFLISGKLLLGSISKLKSEIRIVKANNKINQNKAKIETDWKSEKIINQQKIENLRIEKWKIVPELNHIEAELNKIKNEKEALVNVFISEYNLAKSYKHKLGNNQIKNILG